MDIYNISIGDNCWSGVILDTIDIEKSNIYGYRDCWVTEGCQKIVVYVKLEDNESYNDFNNQIKDNKNYINYEEDTEGYFYMYFEIPSDYEEILEKIEQEQNRSITWENFDKIVYREIKEDNFNNAYNIVNNFISKNI